MSVIEAAYAANLRDITVSEDDLRDTFYALDEQRRALTAAAKTEADVEPIEAVADTQRRIVAEVERRRDSAAGSARTAAIDAEPVASKKRPRPVVGWQPAPARFPV